jgi:hypothetical protein
MRYVAAFRTYTWDEDVAELARRFFRACPAARQVVLADETRGPLGIRDYEVISHTEDTSAFGLLVYPKGNSLWHNVDYGLYILRARLPGYDYYLTSESDLAVNLLLDPIMARIAGERIDLTARWVREATPDWYWYKNARGNFAHPLGSLLFFMVVSARAVDLLYLIRRRMTLNWRAGGQAEWPFCEVFVPTVLKAAGMKFADIGAYADTANLQLRPRLLLSDPRANRPGSLAHSVLGKAAYIRAMLKEYSPTDWLDPESELRRALSALQVRDYAPQLGQAFIEAQNLAGIRQLSLEAEAEARAELLP